MEGPTFSYHIESQSDRIWVRVGQKFTKDDARECIQMIRNYLEESPNPERVAIIWDFYDMKQTSMTQIEMILTAALMRQFKLKSFFSIPPMGISAQNYLIRSLLDKSIPIFHHHGIFVFLVKERENASEIVDKVQDQRYYYKNEFLDNILVTHSPACLIKEVVDLYLVELADHLKSMPIYRNRGLILNFSKLQESTMQPDQMEKLAILLSSQGFRSIISIPPEKTELNEVAMKSLLNQSLPLLHRKGIHVDFAPTMEKALKMVRETEQLHEDLFPAME